MAESAKTAWKRRRRESGQCESCGKVRDDPSDIRLCCECRKRYRESNRLRMALSRSGKPPKADARFSVEKEPDTKVDFKPTRTRPGTEERIQVLALRFAAGLPLWHEKDAKLIQDGR